MDITFINVGYGDSIFIRACEAGDFRMLIDGGTANPAEFTGSRIPSYNWLRENEIDRLDVVVLSHIHDDHVCGLEKIIAELDVGELWLPYPVEIFENSREVQIFPNSPNNLVLFTRAFNCIGRIVTLAKSRGITMRELKPGETSLAPQSGLTFKVLGPERVRKEEFLGILEKAYRAASDEEALPQLVMLDRLSNDASLLLRVSDAHGSALFPGDSCPLAWAELIGTGELRSDIWKLPHHGQMDSITQEAILDIQPHIVVTTSASDRRYNSSNPAVYETIRNVLPADHIITFLFSDEYSYPPHFSGKEGSHAVRVSLDGTKPRVAFE